MRADNKEINLENCNVCGMQAGLSPSHFAELLWETSDKGCGNCDVCHTPTDV